MAKYKCAICNKPYAELLQKQVTTPTGWVQWGGSVFIRLVKQCDCYEHATVKPQERYCICPTPIEVLVYERRRGHYSQCKSCGRRMQLRPGPLERARELRHLPAL